MAILNKNNFLIELSVSPKTSFGKIDFASQTPAKKVFSTIWSVESEVNNGGFKQYFCNSSAETAGSLVDAMIEIKALNAAKICGKAIALVFPKGIPSSENEISDEASKIDHKTEVALEKLDNEFYKYPDDLTELLYNFVCSYPEDFSSPTVTKKPAGLLQKWKKFFVG